jgi:CheY-like chemotaxis protein
MKSARILILDDDPAIGELLGEMISLLGYRPTSCETAEIALDMLQRQRFDAVISDFRMPGLDGRAFFERVQISHPMLARKIVFLTGDTLNDELQSFLDDSGSQCISKPFRLNAIEEMLERVLNEQHDETLQEPVPA